MTITWGKFLVSSTDDDPLPSVCGFKTSPCVRSKLPRVYVQNFPVCTGTTRTCFNTCSRGAGIHGDVLNVHTVTFLNPHTSFSTFFQGAATHTNTHRHTQTHTHKHTRTHTPNTPRPLNNTTTTTTHTTQHNTQHHTDRERKRERQRETEKERQDKTREDGTRQKDKRRWKGRRYKTRRQEKMKEERRDKKTREDERGETRQEDKRRSKEEKREDKKRSMSKREEETGWKRREKMTQKMKRDRGEFFSQQCFKTLKPARWISPKCFEKNLRRTNYSSIFLRTFRIWPCFQLFTRFEFDFFGPGELIQKYFWAARYKWYSNTEQNRKLRTIRGSWFIYNLFIPQHPTTPSGQEIDHSDHHPAIESSESVDRQARWNPFICETWEVLLHGPIEIPEPKKKWITMKNGQTRAIPTYLNGCKNSERILWMTEFLNTETHTPILSHESSLEPTLARKCAFV